MDTATEFKDQVLAKLQERGVRVECELCGTNDWVIVNHPVAIIITDYSLDAFVPGPTIPSAGLICKNCGNIRLLALGSLDLLPDRTPRPRTEAHPMHVP